MAQSLPAQPSLEHLKNQAKSLLRAARSGSPEAVARLMRYSHESPRSESHAWKLADAQHAIAQEYGFQNWAQLKQHVEDLQLAAQTFAQRLERLIRNCLDGSTARAMQMLDRFSDLADANIYVSASVGHLAGVETWLDRDPTLVNMPGGPLAASPLVYACASHFAKPGQQREPVMGAVVQFLLERGADPNASWRSSSAGDGPLSALYAASGIHANPRLTRLLLEHGANPNDNESLYHSTEHPSTACTELLLDHGAVIGGSNAVHQAVAQGNLMAVRLFLDRGADANERLGSNQPMPLLHWAIECHQSREMLELLVERGADWRAVSFDGMTPFRRAMFRGHRAAVELLESLGAGETLKSEEQFFAACMLGDERNARRLLETIPGGVSSLPLHCRGMLYAAAWRGNQEAVRTMLAIGFPVAAENANRATALHAAAWQGDLELTKLLVANGAPLDIVETQFQCTPLEWALHGSCHGPHRMDMETHSERESDYAKIVSLLLAKGSPSPVERLVRICTGAVEEALAAAGIVVDDVTSPETA